MLFIMQYDIDNDLHLAVSGRERAKEVPISIAVV